MTDQKLYILMVSVHGLMRGHDMELGRDADTGGQITYVIELARALGRNNKVAQVDLLTRRIEDPQVSRIMQLRLRNSDRAHVLSGCPAALENICVKSCCGRIWARWWIVACIICANRDVYLI